MHQRADDRTGLVVAIGTRRIEILVREHDLKLHVGEVELLTRAHANKLHAGFFTRCNTAVSLYSPATASSLVSSSSFT